MDQRVINSLKCYYESVFLGKLLNFETGPNMIQDFKKQFSIKDCVNMLREAWESVAEETLINAWHKVRSESLFFDSDDDAKEFGGFKYSLGQAKAAERLQYAKYSIKNLRKDNVIQL